MHSFFWFKEREGDMTLSREECWHIALSFLHKSFPNRTATYVSSDGMKKNPMTVGKMFTFRVYGANVPVYLQYVQVCAPTTGDVDHFTGIYVDPDQLATLSPLPPKWNRKRRKHNLQALDFKLAWQKDDDKGEDAYMLVYKMRHRDTQK